MLKDLIAEYLPHLGGDIVENLLRNLEDEAQDIATDYGAKLVARAFVKGIDGFAKVAVQHLDPGDTEEFTSAYLAHLVAQVDQLTLAIDAYVPFALDVERSKKQWGSRSAEVTAARKRREAGITELRQEVQDVLRAVVGDEPKD